MKKAIVETISVGITGSSDVHCFDLYLINIFTKLTKAERWTDVMFKLAFYCLSVIVEDLNVQQTDEDINILGTPYFFLLDATSGVWWGYGRACN